MKNQYYMYVELCIITNKMIFFPIIQPKRKKNKYSLVLLFRTQWLITRTKYDYHVISDYCNQIPFSDEMIYFRYQFALCIKNAFITINCINDMLKEGEIWDFLFHNES